MDGLRYRTTINEYLWPELEDIESVPQEKVSVEAISMILFLIINGKPSGIE